MSAVKVAAGDGQCTGSIVIIILSPYCGACCRRIEHASADLCTAVVENGMLRGIFELTAAYAQNRMLIVLYGIDTAAERTVDNIKRSFFTGYKAMIIVIVSRVLIAVSYKR